MRRALASVALTTLILLGGSPARGQGAPPTSPASEQRIIERTLDNGVRVIAIDVPGSGMVGVEMFYDVGIAHDPPGIPQLTHLIEHVMVRGATADRGADEAMNRLNAIGMHNAETMGSATHYDYAAPAGALAEILDIERDRLTSLVIDRAIIGQEFPRCAAELTNIERLPQAPVGKFAIMAAHQVWRSRGDRVSILRSDASPEAISRAHRDLYHAGALRVVIVGDVRTHESVRLADEALGTLPNSPAPARQPIDWSQIPPDMGARWDGSRDVVIVAFPPPTDAFERAVLTLWGGVMVQHLSISPLPGALAGSVLTTSSPFPVGESPFFVCAVPGEGVPPGELATSIRRAIREARDPQRAASHAGLIVASSAQMLRAAPPARVRAQADQLLRFRGLGEDQRQAMTGLVLVNHALHVGMNASLLDDLSEEDRARLGALTGEQLRGILAEFIADDRARVLVLRAG